MIPRFARLSLAFAASVTSFPLLAQTPPAAPAPAAAATPAAPVPAVAPASVPVIKPVDNLPVTGGFKLSGAPLDAVLKHLTVLTGRFILRPFALPTAEYTIDIDRTISKKDLIEALLTELKHNQVGVSPQGDLFLNVVPLGLIKNEAPEMIEGSTLGFAPSGRIAAKIFQLDFLRAAEFVQLIGASLTNGVGGIQLVDKANAVIITDTISNLQRVESLMEKLDRPVVGSLRPRFFTLKHGAKASEVVNRLRTILQARQNELGTNITYNADDRTNKIVLLADPRLYPIFDELIAGLDVTADPNTGQEVIFLKYAEAKVVGPLLTQLVSGQNSATQRNNQQSVRPGQIVTPGQPTAPTVASPPGGVPLPWVMLLLAVMNLART